VARTTQIVLIGAGIGVLLNSYFQRRNDRRTAHELAVAAARLIKGEIQQAVVAAETALEAGEEGVSVSTSEWDTNKTAVSGRLSQGELFLVDRFYAVARSRKPRPIVRAGRQMALPTIHWLAEGKEGQRLASLVPRSIHLPCKCGHPVSAHANWRPVRRRVRVRHRSARYVHKGFECRQCGCTKFRGVGDLEYA
jgi:hypothetical protein